MNKAIIQTLLPELINTLDYPVTAKEENLAELLLTLGFSIDEILTLLRTPESFQDVLSLYGI